MFVVSWWNCMFISILGTDHLITWLQVVDMVQMFFDNSSRSDKSRFVFFKLHGNRHHKNVQRLPCIQKATNLKGIFSKTDSRLTPSLKLTASWHLKMDGWKTIRLPFWDAAYFQGCLPLVSGSLDPDFEVVYMKVQARRKSKIWALTLCTACKPGLLNPSQVPRKIHWFPQQRSLFDMKRAWLFQEIQRVSAWKVFVQCIPWIFFHVSY